MMGNKGKRKSDSVAINSLMIRIEMEDKLEAELVRTQSHYSLWALRDDDGGGQAARARLARRFDFIGQPVTVRAAQTQTWLTH